LRDEAQAEAHYKLPANPATYGLPELFRASTPRDAKLIANPGCYATAAALALAPLLREFTVQSQSLVINAASGVSGAGRKGSEEFSLTALRDDYRAYRVLNHQHEPEIVQTLSEFCGKDLELTFTPHLIPVTRGILITAHARLEQPVRADSILEVYINQYGREPFIDLAEKADDVRLSAVVGTNRCQIGFTLQDRRIIACAAIDNLIKGAAGQAVQNFNLLFGFPETESLITLRRYQS
jgi:N-acetyl-gamma-glutamyl-phosphate reductase